LCVIVWHWHAKDIKPWVVCCWNPRIWKTCAWMAI